MNHHELHAWKRMTFMIHGAAALLVFSPFVRVCFFGHCPWCMSRKTLLAGTAMLRMDTHKSDATLDAEIED